MLWKLHEAKNRLSELMNLVISEGPQFIRRREESFVVLSESEYRKLTGERPSLKQLLLEGPSLEGLELQRDESPMRPVDL